MYKLFGTARLLLVSVLLITLSVADELPAQAQTDGQEDFKIKVDVDLVTTDVTILGNAASELRAEDFVIYDNNVAQPVSHFSRDQFPLAIAILVDASLSIQPYLPVLQIAAASSLRRLKPEDQVVLYSFDRSTSKLSDLTEDRYLIAEKIGRLKIGFGTNIFGTVHDAARFLKKNAPGRRRAIILVSDNCQRFGSSSADSNRVELLETGTTLYNIRTPGDHSRDCFKPDIDIKQLAQDTGGQVLDVDGPTAIQEVLEKAISNLRMQYTIGFNPSSPGAKGSFHRLSVRFAAEDRCPGCRLLARSGYYSGVTTPLAPPEKPRLKPQHSPEKTDELLVQRSIVNAGSIDADLPGIPFKVNTAQHIDSSGQPQVKVDLQIAFHGVVFRKIEDRHACKLRVAIFYADSKGKIFGSDWRTIEGQLTQETYDRVIATGVSFSTVVPRKHEKQMLKIVVYDEESDKVGSKLVRLQ